MQPAPAAGPTGTQLAILFADVAGSTGLYERLGDAAARALVAGCLGTMAVAVAQQGGRVIKTIGDEVMARFDSADAALLAASEMQRAVTAARVLDGRPLEIRIGLHFGPALMEEGDVFGDAVNVAARLVAEAKGGQILTSEATLDAAEPTWRQGCRLVDVATLRGRQAPLRIFESIWQAEESTILRYAPHLATPSAAPRLVLLAAGQRVELSEARPSLTIGRGGQNDLVLDAPIVSRLHARIDLRRGRCVLTDQSTNGTFIHPADAAPVFLRHDSRELGGSGLIGFGEAPAPGAAKTVGYEVRGA